MVPSSAVLPYWTAPVIVTEATTNSEPVPPIDCVGSVYNGVWYSYRPPAAGLYTFSFSGDTATTLLDTAMAVYTGTCNALTLLACNDDQGDLRSAVSLNLSANVTYYVVVWSAYAPAEPGEETVQLRVSRPVVPPNDTCVSAEILPNSGPFPYFTSTNDITLAGTTGDPPAPSCYNSGRKSVWFRFTPAATGSYFITTGNETATTVHETVMGIYSSPGCGGYTPVACDYVPDERAYLTRTLTRDTRYHIVVWDADVNSPTPGETSVQLAVTMANRPTVTTLAASHRTSTSARLNSSVAPNALTTRAWFEWGTDPTYGSNTTRRLIGSGVRPVLTNATISGLIPGTTYHYRAVATNSFGTNYGASMSFVFNWSNARPQLAPLTLETDGSYRLRFNAVAGQVYRVESSDSLATWTDLGAAEDLENGLFEFLHRAAPASRRFYRVRAP